MWHASVKTYAGAPALAREMAERALTGVGDLKAGEWRHDRPQAYHLRRRLSAEELQLAGGLSVRDIRGSPEERKRFALLFADAPRLRAIFGGADAG